MIIEKEVILDKLKKYGKWETEQSNSEVVIAAGIPEIEAYAASIRGNLIALKNNEVNTSARFIERAPGMKGKLKWFVKKVVRRLNFFYVQPVCDQQTVYNTAATQCVEKLLEMEVYLSNKIQEFQNERQIMQQAHDTLREELQNEISLLNKKTDQYIENMKIIEGTGVCKFADTSDYVPKKSYAQSGEDLIIYYVLSVLGINIQKVTYLDLGANHAKELSNTFALYKKGARGVLLEANPALIPELKLNRNEDVIVNKCLALQSNVPILFYVLNGDGLSTADRSAVDEMIAKNPELTIEKEVEVQTITIQELLEQYFIEAPTVLNIDLEGMEFNILSNIDFVNIRPLIIIVEMIEYGTMINAGNKDKRILQLMEQNNYIEYAFTGINSIFVDAMIWESEDK